MSGLIGASLFFIFGFLSVIMFVLFVIGMISPKVFVPKPPYSRSKIIKFEVMSVAFFILAFVALYSAGGSTTSNDLSSNNTKPTSSQIATTDKTAAPVKEDTPEVAPPVPEKTDEEILSEFKLSCVEIPFKDLARNVDLYKGKPIYLKGEIIEISDTSKNAYARINMTKGEYGHYDDTVFVNFKLKENEPYYLVDDVVELWGTIEGRLTYTSVLGADVTLPEITAMDIALVEEADEDIDAE